MAAARARLAKLKTAEIADVASILGQTLCSTLTGIIDSMRPTRAVQLAQRQERVNFLTQKARESGVTVADLERVAGSAYILVPYINYFEAWKRGEYRLHGGLLVYQVDVAHAGGIRLLAQRETDNSVALAFTIVQPDVREFTVDQFLYPYQAFIRETFPLRGQVLARSGCYATVWLGSRDALKLDDKLDFFEEVAAPDMGPRRRHVGYGTVVSVGDSRSSVHIIYGNVGPGMEVTQRVRLPAEVRFSLVSHPVRVRAHPSMSMFTVEKENSLCPGVNALILLNPDLRLQMSWETRIPQTYLTFSAVGLGFPTGARLGGVVDYKQHEFRGSDASLGYLEIVKLGVAKRFYLWRFGVGIQGATNLWVGVLHLRDGDSTYASPSTGVRLGAEGSIFTELVITPDVSIGVRWSRGVGSGIIRTDAGNPLRGPEFSLATYGWEVYLVAAPNYL